MKRILTATSLVLMIGCSDPISQTSEQPDAERLHMEFSELSRLSADRERAAGRLPFQLQDSLQASPSQEQKSSASPTPPLVAPRFHQPDGLRERRLNAMRRYKQLYPEEFERMSQQTERKLGKSLYEIFPELQ